MTTMQQPRPGPQRAAPSTPPRAPASVRRTTSIDSTRPDGLTGRVLAVVAGQDLVTDAGGHSSVAGRFAIDVPVDPDTGEILGFDGHDGTADLTDLARLVGASLRSGFGRALASALPEEAENRSLRYSLLEDLAGAFLVSGYAPLRAGLLVGDPAMGKERARHQADICIGWADGGPVHRSLAERGHTAVPTGPVAPQLERADPAGWHPLAPLGHGTVRRRRRLDVARGPAGNGLRAQSHLRDSYAGDEPEMVMHEYAVDAVIDDDRIAGIDVDPRVLPWEACPGAVASAQRVVGVPLDDMARRARTELVGVSTCTHLTSTIRCLADVRALARLARRS
jgi:Protein of unknown function (DUF2889)